MFSVKVDGKEAFVYQAGQGWSFFNFAFANTVVQVEVTVNKTIHSWQVRPVSANVAPAQDGSTFTFTLAKPTKLILQINGRNAEKLLISAESPESDAPKPNDPGVLYYPPGVHFMGYKFTPPPDIDTIYLAGGAVVRGTLRIENRQHFKIMGRGMFAMGEWPHDEDEGLNLHYNDGLVVDGVTIVDSPGWQLSIGGSNSAIVRNVKLLATKTHFNSDGVQMWYQRRVSVTDFFILANDDAISVSDGGVNINVADGVLWNNTNGASFMLGWGGGNDTHDVSFENVDVLENGCRYCGVFSARWGDIHPARVSRVTFRRIRVENAHHADGTQTSMIDMRVGASPWNSGPLGRFQSIRFEDVTFPFGGGAIRGWDAENGFSYISFVNCTLGGKPLTDVSQLGILTKFVTEIDAHYDTPFGSITGSAVPTVQVAPTASATPQAG